VETIAIASDHAGYKLKQTLIDSLSTQKHKMKDFGADSDATPCDDYMLLGAKVAHYVVEGKADCGILICGTGIGMSIAANRVHGARAALCNDLYSAEKSRQHNDANLLILGARVIGEVLALAIVETWLRTEYEGGRHVARNAMLIQVEEECDKRLFD
jgi:ribose 5-phosphate isomerase B